MNNSGLSTGSWLVVCTPTALCAGFIIGIELSRLNDLPGESCTVPSGVAVPAPTGLPSSSNGQ
jgi:hypothetical protein